MSPRSLVDLVLRILGVFFLKDVLEALSRFFSVLVYLPQYDSAREGYVNLGVTVPALVLYSLLCWVLIFRSGWLIRVLKLDRFSAGEPVSFSYQRSALLSVAVIFIGGWTLVNELPELFRHMVYYVQERKLYVRMARPDVSYLLMSAAKVMVGLVLIIFNRFIVRFIEIRRRPETAWYWPAKIPFNKKKKKNPA